ncbi:MAG: hypothetical protein ACPGVY_12190 [Mycobacterium sp.]
MALTNRGYTIDTALQLEDGAAAITATEVNSGGELDLGAYEGTGATEGSRFYGVLVLNVTALDAASNDELYTIELQGTNTTGFGTATDNVVLASIQLGAHEATGAVPGDTGTDTPTGVYEVPFCNVHAGSQYRYVRLKVTVAGTSPSVTYQAHIGIMRR